MRQIITIILLFTIALKANPYEDLNYQIKLNLILNYFINKEIKDNIPSKPIKGILEDDGLNTEPIKYEKYFQYIQRIKAIHESRTEAQQNIDDKYAQKVEFYNAKLKVLKKFYKDSQNLNPIIQNGINKAFKVIYGKPIFKDLKYSKDMNSIEGLLFVQNIYNIEHFKSKKIVILNLKDKSSDFLDTYQDIRINVRFKYYNDTLSLKDILFAFDSDWYTANFVEKTNKNFKLQIKINDDIFSLIKIENNFKKGNK